jgi:hypothetical protein
MTPTDRRRLLLHVLRVLLVVACLAQGNACFTYDPPPRATLPEAKDGILPDPSAPLVVQFTEAVEPKTVKLTIARYVVDPEGNLPDEDASDDTTLDVLFQRDPNEDNPDRLGVSTFQAGNTQLSIKPSATLPIGPRLVMIIEAGLADRHGNATQVRTRIVFGYQIKLDCNKPVVGFKSGQYFSLVDVSNPIKVQIRLFASFDVDPATGRFIAQFTRAMRNPDLARCTAAGLSCKSTEVCRLLPAPGCVIPSERVGDVDEWSDLVGDATSDAGFTFTAEGCVVDQADGTTSMAASPVDVKVRSPAVTLRSTHLSAAFKADASGVLRGTGSLNAEQVQLGDIASGGGQGDMTFRSIPPGVIPGIPAPPPRTAGTSGP